MGRGAEFRVLQHTNEVFFLSFSDARIRDLDLPYLPVEIGIMMYRGNSFPLTILSSFINTPNSFSPSPRIEKVRIRTLLTSSIIISVSIKDLKEVASELILAAIS